MTFRLFFCLMLAILPAGCASVPERYAFWRDDTAVPGSGKIPNLGDVPEAPKITESQQEIDALRLTMEHDRAVAWRAAQGNGDPAASQDY